ncbi:MAG: NAD-dependent epimerase/dehydratase family protein [Chloroflexi bacterium]|nr:NAD-dependent epimerase/dehydratase family protein [Chloroflexota bacterium]
MKVLVTGGLGAHGSWVVRQLHAEGHIPVIFDNHQDMTLLPDLAGKVTVVAGDIREIADVIRAVKEHQVTVIAHIAALKSPVAQANPKTGFAVNAGGTVNILEAARITGVERVVYTSSKWAFLPCGGEYGHPTYKRVNETYSSDPEPKTSVYGAAKVASELMGNTYSEQYGFGFIALRFASTFGPSARRSKPVFAQMIDNAMSGHPTVIPQGGEEQDDMTYAKDIANSVVLACFSRKVKHRVFHIGTGRGHRLTDLAGAIKRVYPEARIEIGPGVGHGRGLNCVMDISRAGEELGYSPHFGPVEAVEDYVKEMKRLGYAPSPGPFREGLSLKRPS